MIRSRVLLALASAALLSAATPAGAEAISLKYAHMNSPDSIAGMQADFFAVKVGQYSGGSLIVEVYPDSQLGGLQELAAKVSSGEIAFHHNTAAGIGSLFGDFAVLDTPYAYKDVPHLLRVVAPSSPVIKRLSEGLLKASGVRFLNAFYFGTRHLTCDRPVRRPGDLAGLRVRSIPFPIYETAVEGLGGIPTPIDWAATPAALAAKVVAGQENPVEIILTGRLYQVQSHLMLTGHILGAEIVVVNDEVWRGFSKSQKEAVRRAAAEAAEYGTMMTLTRERENLEELGRRGMKVIGPAEGLDAEAFRSRASGLVSARCAERWAGYYALIDSMR